MKHSLAVDISALDPAFKEHATRGIGRYALELHKFIELRRSLDPDLRIDFFNHRQILADSRLAKLIDLLPAGRTTARQQILYPLRLNSGDLKQYRALHFLAQMDAPTWCPKPYILTVHDIIPLVCADLYKADNPNWRYRLARHFELKAITNASMILTNSVCTKNDLVNVLRLDPAKIFVTLLGVDQLFFEPTAAGDLETLRQRFPVLREPYFLYVGGIDPRKNLSTLLRVYGELKGKLFGRGKTTPKLVLAGKYAGHRDYPKLEERIREQGLNDHVVFTGYVTDAELTAFYARALGLCFFSLYEGFGLTVLEAFATGCPVIASNNSAIPEVAGNCADLVDPNDPGACLAAMESLALNGDRGSREARIAQARQFTWQKTGELTFAAYREFFQRLG